jgi:hypothetical protein
MVAPSAGGGEGKRDGLHFSLSLKMVPSRERPRLDGLSVSGGWGTGRGGALGGGSLPDGSEMIRAEGLRLWKAGARALRGVEADIGEYYRLYWMRETLF